MFSLCIMSLLLLALVSRLISQHRPRSRWRYPHLTDLSSSPHQNEAPPCHHLPPRHLYLLLFSSRVLPIHNLPPHPPPLLPYPNLPPRVRRQFLVPHPLVPNPIRRLRVRTPRLHLHHPPHPQPRPFRHHLPPLSRSFNFPCP